MLNKNKNIITLIMYCLISAINVQAAENHLDSDYEIVVNPSVSINSITTSELKQILLTNQTNWKDEKKITIITLSSDFSGADEISRKYMNMTATQAKKYWLTKVFNNVLHNQPPSGDTPQEVVEKVASIAGSIAIVPKNTPPGKTKVITETP